MTLWSWFKSFVWRRSWFWFKIKFHVILILKSLFNHLKSLLNQFEKLIEENSDFAVKVVQYAIISGSGCWLVRNTSILGQEKCRWLPSLPDLPTFITYPSARLCSRSGIYTQIWENSDCFAKIVILILILIFQTKMWFWFEISVWVAILILILKSLFIVWFWFWSEINYRVIFPITAVGNILS